MSRELKTVIAQISHLPDSEQKAIAQLLKDELSWQYKFTKTQKKLEKLGEEALQEFRDGKTLPLKLK